MRFEPKSEEELNKLIPDKTICDAEVYEASNFHSKSGNEGIKLKVRVWDADGGTKLLDDYLMSTESSLFKVLNFCKASGLAALYESGELRPVDCEGRTVQVKVGIEEQEGYPPKNRIISYVVPKEAKESKRTAPKTPKYESVTAGNPVEDDSEIPF